MNPFEKIFNYQIVSRLEDSGTFMVTGHERSWLKAALGHEAANEAFTVETRQKLASLLETDDAEHTGPYLQHKAASKVKHVYHPLIRQLRRAIMNRQLLRLDCLVKQDRLVTGEPAWPYKLEYSMVKHEWYLLWYHTQKHTLMSTKLQQISAITVLPCSEARYAQFRERTLQQLDKRKQTVAIKVMKPYTAELSRILYAFSCFEKKVNYDADEDSYTIIVTYYGSESEFVLQKVRFLGKRVRVLDEGYMSGRMRESAAKALARYSN